MRNSGVIWLLCSNEERFQVVVHDVFAVFKANWNCYSHDYIITVKTSQMFKHFLPGAFYQTHTHTHTHKQTNTKHTYTHKHTHIHTYTHRHTHAYTHAHTCAHTHTHTRAHTHTHTRACMHACTHSISTHMYSKIWTTFIPCVSTVWTTVGNTSWHLVLLLYHHFHFMYTYPTAVACE